MTARIVQQAARVATGVALAVAVAAPLPLAALAQGTAAVSMVEDSPEHYAFSPGSTTMPVGTTVTWTDRSDTAHTVTSDSGAFGSSVLQPNQTFRFTFSKAGTFAYHCSIHSYMHGTIVVTATANGAAQPAPAVSSATTQSPARMPSTGAGGMAAPTGGSIAALLVGAGALLAALRRRR